MTDTQGGTTAAEEPAAPRRLTRSNGDRMVAGVCGGLADYTGIDPVVFRVIVAVSAIMGGAGLVAYGAAWLVIPAAEDHQSHAEAFLHGRRLPRMGLVGIGIVALIIASTISSWGWGHHWGGGGFGLIVIVGVGLWFWSRDQGLSAVPPRPAPAAAPPVAAPTVVAPSPPPRPTGAPRVRRRRSKLFAVTCSAALLAAGVLTLLDVMDVARVSAATVLATCLVVTGAGLLVGSRYGRGRALIAVGIVLGLATAAATVADIPLHGGTGERTWAPTSVSSLDRTYELAVGQGTLDLRSLELGGRTRHITARVGVGELQVRLPADAHTVIRSHAGAGQVLVLGREDDGLDVDHTAHVTGTGGTIELDARVGMGHLEVTR